MSYLDFNIQNPKLGAGGASIAEYSTYALAVAASYSDGDIVRITTGAGAGLYEYVGDIDKVSGTHGLNWLLPSGLATLVRTGQFLEDGSSNPIHVATSNGGGSDTASSVTTKWPASIGAGGSVTDDAGDIKLTTGTGSLLSTSIPIPWVMVAGGPNPVLVLAEIKGTYIGDSRSPGGGYFSWGDDFSDVGLTTSVTAAGAANRLEFSFSTTGLTWAPARGLTAYPGTVNLSGDFAPLAFTGPAKWTPSATALADGSKPNQSYTAWELGEGSPDIVTVGAPYNTSTRIHTEETSISASGDNVSVGVTTASAEKSCWLRRLAAIELGVP
jgi:hypothetical protein